MMYRLRQTSFLTESILTLICGISAGLIVLGISLTDLPLKFTAVIVGGVIGVVFVLAVGDIKRLLLAAIFFDLTTGFDFHIPCVENIFVSECGFNISVTTIALVILYFVWILEYRHAHGAPFTLHPSAGTIGRFGASFFLASLVSLTAARDVSLSLYMVWIYITMLALFFYLANHIHSQQDLLMIVMLLALGLLLQGGVMQLKVTQIIPNDTLVKFQNRVTGTFRSPNSAGAFLMQMILLLLPCLALKLKSWQRAVLLATLLLASYDLIGSESRGAWTGILIGIGIILVVSIAKKWLSLKALAAIFISVSILGVIFSGPIITRLSADDNGAADARGPLMQIASNMIRANPVVGVGWNNFGLALYDYIEIDQFGAWLNLVHNGWLLIWSETGTISFALFVAFWLAIAWHAIKLIRKGQQFYGLLALGILASMAGAATHMMVEIFASRVLAQIIWTNAALITAMIRMQQQEDALLANDLSSATKGSIQREQHALQTGR